MEAVYVHDAAAFAAVLDPSLFEWREGAVVVVTDGPVKGRTIRDEGELLAGWLAGWLLACLHWLRHAVHMLCVSRLDPMRRPAPTCCRAEAVGGQQRVAGAAGGQGSPGRAQPAAGGVCAGSHDALTATSARMGIQRLRHQSRPLAAAHR